MKLSQDLNEYLNEQILHELRNQYLYIQIANYFEELQLKNLANYFTKQAEHEYEHSKKFIQHINSRAGGKVKIGEIEVPNIQLYSIEDVADVYIQTEESTTESIEELYRIANELKSFVDLPFLLSILQEQVEEEDSANKIGLKLKMCKDIVLLDAMFN